MPPQSSSPGGEGELSPILKARQGERIPSSETPSPMKIKNMIPDSPVKSTQLDEQVTKKLQDSITNLLGKRRSSAEEEAAGAGGGASHGRAAKRTRPMSRSKVCFLFNCILLLNGHSWCCSRGVRIRSRTTRRSFITRTVVWEGDCSLLYLPMTRTREVVSKSPKVQE